MRAVRTVRVVGGVGRFGSVFSQVMNDGAGRGESVEVAIEAEAGEFGHAELLAEDAVRVIVLEGPVVDAAFYSAGAIEKGVLRGFEKLCEAREKRFAEGSGLPIRISTIELIELGAGGGSIAHLDAIGLLKVGPESAGSEPGPAAYGLGGAKPRVTEEKRRKAPPGGLPGRRLDFRNGDGYPFISVQAWVHSE